MDIHVKKINDDQKDHIDIYCHQINNEIQEIVSFIKSRDGHFTCTIEGRQYEIPITDILYIESVDNKCFIYTNSKSLEIKYKIYELEDMLKDKNFIRISKASIVNLMKIKSIKPALNGRFSAILLNGEEIIISRKYVSDFKKVIKGGR